jgi:hypothetical protein
MSRRNFEFRPPEQEVLDKNFFQAFNMEQKDEKNSGNRKSKILFFLFQNQLLISSLSRKTGSTSNQTHMEEPNLIDMGTDSSSSALLDGNVFELFDPLKQSDRTHSWPSQLNRTATNTATPPFVTPTSETPPIPVTISPSPSPSIPPNSYPYPIKLRLKLTTFPEIKPFSQLVQQIRNENQTKPV